MSTRLGERTPQEKLEQATRELTESQVLFASLKRKLQLFDEQHPVLDTQELIEERAWLERLFDEARLAMKEKYQIQRFMHHECFAMDQGWGKGPEPWRR
jgi:hypothetical protein